MEQNARSFSQLARTHDGVTVLFAEWVGRLLGCTKCGTYVRCLHAIGMSGVVAWIMCACQTFTYIHNEVRV